MVVSMMQNRLPKSAAHNRATNEEIASTLDETADLLEAQGANPFRVAAYRKAAETIRGLAGSAAHILAAEGVAGLIRLPAIGRSLAHSIDHIVRTRRLPLLERLRGEDVAERSFATVPDIGPELARRIHEQLGIETLRELQAAANDGRLAEVPGMGRKRIRAVRESLAGRFQRQARPAAIPPRDAAPDVPVAELLDIDAEYQRLARQKKLPRIAPRRFNPTGEAWLPILHTQREGRHYTALYSNTARAHELGTTHDWVVIYRDDDGDHGRWTVITANYGTLRGRRIIPGREAACLEYYRPSRPPRDGMASSIAASDNSAASRSNYSRSIKAPPRQGEQAHAENGGDHR